MPKPSEIPLPNHGDSGSTTNDGLNGLSAAIVAAIAEGFGLISQQQAALDPSYAAVIANNGLGRGGALSPEDARAVASPSPTAAGRRDPSDDSHLPPPVANTESEPHEKNEGEKEKAKFRSVAQDGWGGFFGALKDGAFEEKSAYSLGFSSLELGVGVSKRIDELDRGQFVSPQERTSATAEAALPGLGGIAGTVVGGIFGNPVLGSFVGGAAGEVGASIIGANEKRDEIASETSERLAASLGGVAESAERMKQALESTGAPLGQLSSGLQILMRTGPGIGSDAVAGAGRMALAEGTDFVENTQALSGFLSSTPALYAARADYTHGHGTDISVGSYRDIARLALSQDDMPAYQAAQEGVAAKTYTDDPQWNKLNAEVKEEQGKTFSRFLRGARRVQVAGVALFNPAMSHAQDKLDNDPIEVAQRDLKERQEELDKERRDKAQKTASDDTAFMLNRGKAKSDLLRSDVETTGLENRFRSASASGDIAQEKALLPQIRTRLDAGAKADDVIIGQDQAAMKKPGFDKNLAPAYQTEIAGAEADKQDRQETRYQSFTSQVFEEQFKGRVAGFSLAETRAQIEGKSASDIEQITRRQSAYLQGIENDPQSPLSPEEKAKIESSRITQNYQSRLAVGTEALSQIDLRTTQAETRVSRAQANSGPQEVYEAQQGVLNTYTARIKELTSELHAGGLAVADRISKEKELATTQGQAAQLEASARQALYTGRHGIADDTLGGLTDGLSRQVAIAGNLAVTPQMIGEAGHLIGIDRDALAAAKTPEEKARYTRAIADDTLQRDQLETTRQTYAPNTDTVMQDVALSGTAARAGRLGGQGAQDAAAAQVVQDQTELSALRDTQRTTTDPLAKVANAQKEQAYLTDIAEKKTSAQTWSETVQQQAGDIEAEGKLHRAELAPYTEQGGDPFTRNDDLIKEKQGLLASAQSALAKTDRSDPAFATNTRAVNSLEDQIAGLGHDKMFAIESLLPETIANAPGRGVGSAILPFAALSSFYGPSTPSSGSWGGHPGAEAGSMAPVGGRSGGFAASGISSGGTATVEALLTRIATALEKGRNPTSSTPASHAAGIVSMLGKSLNAHDIH